MSNRDALFFVLGAVLGAVTIFGAVWIAWGR
jgi:hypothetical protein